MKTMTYSESRAHYAETLNTVINDREEVVITRAGHDPVVMVALDDYESLKEAAYLLRSPENARRLLASIDRLEHGAGVPHELADETPGPTTYGGKPRTAKSSRGLTPSSRTSHVMATKALANPNPSSTDSTATGRVALLMNTG
jgi:antitoxin YefM